MKQLEYSRDFDTAMPSAEYRDNMTGRQPDMLSQARLLLKVQPHNRRSMPVSVNSLDFTLMNHNGKTAPVNDVLRYRSPAPRGLGAGRHSRGRAVSIERGVPYMLCWKASSIAVTKTVVLRP
jgi:hypothetical protein